MPSVPSTSTGVSAVFETYPPEIRKQAPSAGGRALDRLVVQVRPGVLDFFQLAQTVRAEVIHGAPITRLRRVRAELPVELPPCETERARESERAIGEPEVEVEGRGRAATASSRAGCSGRAESGAR